MRPAPILRAVAAAALAVIGCTNSGENRVTGLAGTGMVDGFVVVDANGSRKIDAGDDSLPGIKVRLVVSGTADTGLVQTTGSTGFYRFTGVPVGVYSLKVDTTLFADTLQVVKVDSQTFTVVASDSVRINALVGRPVLTVRQARVAVQGRRVFVVAVALTSASAFADSTANIADTSGSIRVVRARTLFAAGDSVRLLGTVGSRAGQPTLNDPTVFSLGQGRIPNATTLTTAAAATAAGGTRDAQLVSVHGAIISDTARTATSFVLTVSDSSGPIQVQLDQTADVAFQSGNLPGLYVPGNKFDIVGVLAPTGASTWRLRPRSAADLTNVPLPAVTIRAARALAAGTIVNVVGVALNGSNTFADSSVFLADTSGAIRLIRLRSSIAAGDSVRVRATMSSRNGQPALTGGTATPLGFGFLPVATTFTTVVAATAAGGTRDAQLVSVHGAIISDTARTATSFVLTVSDSSGPLEVQLDRTADAAFQAGNLPGPYVPGNKFAIVGVLAPTGTGTWRLWPRSATDLTNVPLPAITIRAARALAAGTIVNVVGVALNASNTFADSAVFLVDTSGAIRLIHLRSSITAGDSVRVRATTSSRNGQPTLEGGTSTSLGFGFLPVATTLTTAVAATAAGGTRDAQLVSVPGATVSDTSRTTTTFVLTVSDGSGPLEVELDRTADAAFQAGNLPGPYVPGNKFDLLGVLAPTASGTWRLRPRSAADLTLIPPPVLSIRAARALPAGQIVTVIGVALNSSGNFSDSTVHLVDTSGAIRLTRLRNPVTTGDSVKVKATTASRAGQPTLDAGTTTPLGQGLFPTAATLSTALAATADGGTRDAQMVVIDSAIVTDTARTPTGFNLTVTDGSGNVTVFLDALAGFQVPTVYVPGNSFKIIGLLAPTGTGTWIVKPRSPADLLRH